jgi:hypothetical protein
MEDIITGTIRLILSCQLQSSLRRQWDVLMVGGGQGATVGHALPLLLLSYREIPYSILGQGDKTWGSEIHVLTSDACVLEVIFGWNGFVCLYKLTMFVCAGIIWLMIFKYRMLNMNEIWNTDERR